MSRTHSRPTRQRSASQSPKTPSTFGPTPTRATDVDLPDSLRHAIARNVTLSLREECGRDNVQLGLAELALDMLIPATLGAAEMTSPDAALLALRALTNAL